MATFKSSKRDELQKKIEVDTKKLKEELKEIKYNPELSQSFVNNLTNVVEEAFNKGALVLENKVTEVINNSLNSNDDFGIFTTRT
jgi:hypothetical protein